MEKMRANSPLIESDLAKLSKLLCNCFHVTFTSHLDDCKCGPLHLCGLYFFHNVPLFCFIVLLLFMHFLFIIYHLLPGCFGHKLYFLIS